MRSTQGRICYYLACTSFLSSSEAYIESNANCSSMPARVSRQSRRMDFKPEAMDQAVGQHFTAICRIVGGLTGKQLDSMLSTLPSELCFNDLRDAGRRHSKSERTVPHNLHAVAHRSSTTRPAGGTPLQLEASDWQQVLTHKFVKARVHRALKATDAELGFSAEGLTKHRSSKVFTKPHILAQRLELLRVLSHVYNEQIRPEVESQEDRMDLFRCVCRGLWLSKLVPAHWFISWSSGAEKGSRLLVLSSGPHFVRVLPLIHDDQDVYTFKDFNVPRDERLVGELGDVVVSACRPHVVLGRLGWQQCSDWLTLPQYIADHAVLLTPRSLLASVCSALGLKHGKLDYKARVRLFLEHMKKDASFISSIIDEIPEAPPRTKKKQPEDPRNQEPVVKTFGRTIFAYTIKMPDQPIKISPGF